MIIPIVLNHTRYELIIANKSITTSRLMLSNCNNHDLLLTYVIMPLTLKITKKLQINV